jgi:adenosylcobinamide-phosphate synthase
MTHDFETALALMVLALLFDRLFGEFSGAWHPVVWIGRAIEECREHLLHGSKVRQVVAGAALALGLPYFAARLSFEALHGLREQPWLQMVLALYLFKATFALEGLGSAAIRVRKLLESDRLDEARGALSSLCSRNASTLSREEVAGAAIESVAENASDSFVAPLFYFALLGIPGAVFYRVVNTMDSMIGYHGEWEWAGKATARLDDLLNWIPARLTAVLLLLIAWVRRMDWKAGWNVWQRDASRTESPNAGRPMAVMAGLLGLKLTKRGHYELGIELRPTRSIHIAEAWSLARAACWAGSIVALILVGVFHG